MFNEDMTIKSFDPELSKAIEDEIKRQEEHIELIASENYASPRVIEAQGSVLTNKYAEGYPGKRYYGGCEYVDVAEQLAIDRLKELYGADYANVQPHSGSQANAAVFMALLQPHDTILGMSLAHGGHLTHGSKVNFSGKIYNAVQYGLNPDTGEIDYDQVEALAKEHKPKMILAGASAYPRQIDFSKFREIADEVGALLMVDMAHISGLVATGLHPSPVPYADIVTSTTHKTLRAGRGGIILTNNVNLGKKINSAVFPGLQGGPLMHAIAGKAVGFKEALEPEFKTYIQSVIDNAIRLGEVLKERGLDLVSDGTDTHLVLVDLRPKGLTGNITEVSLEAAGITCNKNGVPFDPEKPMVTSGVRLGTPAGTTRGFGLSEFEQVAHIIGDVLDGLASNKSDNSVAEKHARAQILELSQRFPIY